MTFSTLRTGLALASAAVALAAPGMTAAKQVPAPTINVVGVDAYCDSFNTSTDSSGITLTCVPPSTTPGGPTAPQNCVATVNSGSSVTLSSSGGSANLAVSCTGANTGISWQRNGAAGVSSALSWTDTLPANTSSSDVTTSYKVTVCNGSACVTVPTNPLTAIVQGQSGGGPTPPPPSGSAWPATCSGFNKTLSMDMNWSSPQRIYTTSYGNFGANDAVVVRFTTGNIANPDSSLPRLVAAEYQSSPSTRIAVLSATPCDFSAQLTAGATTSGNTVTVPFTVNNPNNWGYYPILKLNTTYYLNIKNAPSSSCTSSGACDIAVDLNKPGGL